MLEVSITTHAESLLVHFHRAEQLKRDAVDLPSVDLNVRQLCDLELLLNRAFYPLDGFMRLADYDRVLEEMRLEDNTLWPMPVCLDVPEALAASLAPGQVLAIRDTEGFMLAVLHVESVWRPDKRREALAVFGTDDPGRHPGVQTLLTRTHAWYVGGRLEGLHLPLHYDFPELRLTPSETHRRFSLSGWRQVVGFQTERPLHCAHKEMVLKAARESGSAIFLHPLVGIPGTGDLDHFTMIRCYQEFVKRFPRNMITLGLLPLVCRKAGPREALWQAIVRKNFGCSHFMVARDHADPNSGQGLAPFYPIGAAQALVRDMEEETGIRMVPMHRMVFVEDRAEYLAEELVDSGMQVKEITSAELDRRLELGLDVPEWFSFPEVVAELRKAHPPRHQQGFTVFITGLSGAGKSTLAKVLYMKFLEMRERPVTLLDGDVVRKYLSSELGFSREHRELNTTRIGFVASEITKNRGIAICAPIAPYEDSRRQNRELISRHGGYVEVHVSTPLEVCELRDRKGLYAKARKGLIKGVTGIDDPYITPVNPEVVIDTSGMTPTEAAQVVLLYLEEQGYIR